MDEKEKVTTPCHDNQLLLEFARGKANAWKRLQGKALSGWCPENSEELERYAFRKRTEAEEEMQKISSLDLGYQGTAVKHFDPEFV